MCIRDRFFSTSIDIDLRQNGLTVDDSKFVGGTTITETLADNFDIVPANPTTYKLKVTINGEEFFIIMSKS